MSIAIAADKTAGAAIHSCAAMISKSPLRENAAVRARKKPPAPLPGPAVA
jgi:hypothetical protein